MKKTYKIVGMTCSACSSSIENRISKLPGVNKASVNLLTNTMDVDYDEKQVDDSVITKNVEELGYKIDNSNENNKQDNSKKRKDPKLKKQFHKLIASIILSIILMTISMAGMLHLPFASFLKDNPVFNTILQLILASIVYILNFHFFKMGFKSLFKGYPNMDSLIAIGAGASYVYGLLVLIGLLTNHVDHFNNLYFEGGAMILTFISLGKYLESKSKAKTQDAILKLIELQPNKVNLVKVDNSIVVVDYDDVNKGDIILVNKGDKIPFDGKLLSNNASVDESLISGESLPISKKANDELVAGTINVGNSFEMRAEKVKDDTSLKQMIKLVEQAANSKAPIAKIADKISRYFVPTIIILSILIFAYWYFTTHDTSLAINFGISVLVISCPCALGLATPVSIMAATGTAANNGILIRNGEVLETASKAKVVFLDKTGTITEGKPKVMKTSLDDQTFKIVSKIETLSNHPLAKAIINYEKPADLQVNNNEEISGKGIKATVGDDEYLVGNRALLDENNITINEKLYKEYIEQALTVIMVAKNQKFVGLIGISDPIRLDSKQAIDNLHKLGLKTVMISGDNEKTAEYVGKKVGVDKVISEVLPKDKANYLKEAQEKGDKVIMCGDGINDALALINADVGVAISSGSDIAMDSADVILRSNDLLDVVNFIKLSKKTLANIKENLFWALIYNVIAIPIAAGLFYHQGLVLQPMIAALAMSCSSLFVVGNALRLRFLHRVKQEVIMKNAILKVDGMMCEHCQQKVQSVIDKYSNLEGSVDLKNHEVDVEYPENFDLNELKNAIEEAGYKVTSIEKK